MEDEDKVEGFQFWSAKSEYKITMEFEDEDHIVTHVIYEPGEGEFSATIHVMGDDDPLPPEWQLPQVEVFKRIFPKS